MSIKIKRYENTHPALGDGTEPWTYEDELKSLLMHRSDVQKGCVFIAHKIIEAGIDHDHSKITLFGIDEEPPADYREGKWHKAHVAAERHHLHAHCPDDVNLIDVIEMLVDCTMAAMSRKGQYKHFPVDTDILQKAYENTVKLLLNEITSVNTDE